MRTRNIFQLIALSLAERKQNTHTHTHQTKIHKEYIKKEKEKKMNDGNTAATKQQPQNKERIIRKHLLGFYYKSQS